MRWSSNPGLPLGAPAVHPVIDAGLGLFGIVTQIDSILSLCGGSVSEYRLEDHVTRIIYFVMYTFLLRHAALDLAGVREDEERRPKVELGYVAASIGFYLVTHLVESGIVWSPGPLPV